MSETRELPDGWTTCADCGDATPEVDAEEGICITCWDGRAFTANAERQRPWDVDDADAMAAGNFV